MAPENPFKQHMIKMRIPDGMGDNISIAGFNLTADEDRCVTVPRRHVSDLESHGLTEYVEPVRSASVKK